MVLETRMIANSGEKGGAVICHGHKGTLLGAVMFNFLVLEVITQSFYYNLLNVTLMTYTLFWMYLYSNKSCVN